MYKIKYKRLLCTYIIEKIECDVKSDNLAIELDSCVSGIIRIGAEVKRIDGKLVIFDTESWQSGIFAPVLYLSDELLSLEPFEIRDGEPREIPLGDSYIRKLFHECDENLRRTRALEEEIKKINKEIHGNPIF